MTATRNRINTHVGRRETYIEQTGPREITVWQSMGKFRRFRVTNGGTFEPFTPPEYPPAWVRAVFQKHGATIREWCGFTNERRPDLPWESYRAVERLPL